MGPFREEKNVEMERLQSEVKEVREVQVAVSQVVEKKEVFLSKLRVGIPILKHGRQGRPKLRMLAIDEGGGSIQCRDQDNKGKDHVMPVDSIQVRA